MYRKILSTSLSTVLLTILENMTISASGWSDVPENLIDLLVDRVVGIATLIRFGSVCRLWHSVASAEKFSKHVPWLMLSEKEGTHLREFYDLSTSEVYELSLAETQGKKILGSSFGWIITASENGEINVLNPFNHMQIALPPHSTFQSEIDSPEEFSPQEVRDLFPQRAIINRDPASGDFTAMLVHTGYDTACLSFCKSSDERWTRFEILGVDMVLDFAGGRFYCMNFGGEVYDCETDPTPKIEAIARFDQYSAMGGHYFVECEGEILLVLRFRCRDDDDLTDTASPKDGTHYYTDHFRVYKLDLKDQCLIEIYNIGDHALFVGANSSLCLPATFDSKVYKKNCIYFTDDYHAAIFGEADDIGGLDMGVYSLDDGSFGDPFPGVSTSKFSLPIWFIPNPC